MSGDATLAPSAMANTPSRAGRRNTTTTCCAAGRSAMGKLPPACIGQLVTFRVGTQEFALDILQVERILRHVTPAPLPKAPSFLEGVVPYEGGAVPVVDLRKRFELPAPVREETRLMVVDLGEQRVGVLVDEVREVLRVDSTTIAAPGPMVSEAIFWSVVLRSGTPLTLTMPSTISMSSRSASSSAF